MKKNYDFVVIGGGSAGYAAAATAAKEGLSVAVIEGGEEIGGLCILHGCMPSKTLLESAKRFDTLRRAREFGLRAENIAAHGDEIIARKKRFISGFADYRREQLEHGKFDFIRGMAGFADAHTLEITTPQNEKVEITARSFLIATGSTENRIALPGLAETGFLDSDAVLDSTVIPDSVIVLGGGAVAMEFSQYYAALGKEVTIIQRGGQVLRDADADVAASLTAAFRKRGVNVYLNTSLLRVERRGAEKRVWFQHEGGEKSTGAAEIIYALGRKAQLHGLNLDRAGVLLAKRGHIACAANQQTCVPHIFGAGDVVGPHEIVHLAVTQGEIAARNAARLLRGGTEPMEEIDYRLKLFAVFSEPQVALVGMTERELQRDGVPCAVACYPFYDHGKSMLMDEIDGFVKLIVAEKSREILGAAVVGPHASDLIHEIAVAMYFRATAMDLMKVPHYHPTLSEIWTYPAEELSQVADN